MFCPDTISTVMGGKETVLPLIFAFGVSVYMPEVPTTVTVSTPNAWTDI